MNEMGQDKGNSEKEILVDHEQVVVNDYLKMHRDNQAQLARLEDQVRQARLNYRQKRTLGAKKELNSLNRDYQNLKNEDQIIVKLLQREGIHFNKAKSTVQHSDATNQKLQLTPRQLYVQLEAQYIKNSQEINYLRRLIKQKTATDVQKADFQRLYEENIVLKNKQKDLKSKTSEYSYRPTLTKTPLAATFNEKNFNIRLTNYLKKQFWVDITYVFFGSFILTVAMDYFVLSTGKDGLFPPGLGAIAKQIAFLLPDQNIVAEDSLYYVLFFALNLPLVIFGILKIGWRFSLLTLLFIALTNVFNIIIVELPYINPAHLDALINYNDLANTKNHADLFGRPIYLIWIFAFALIGACVGGLGYGLVYTSSGSTAGLDFLSAYLQKKKQISIASVNKIINLFVIVIVVIWHSLLMSDQDLYQYFNYDGVSTLGKHHLLVPPIYQLRLRYIFGPTFFASFVYLWLVSLVTNSIYPKFKYVQLTIYTKNAQHILEALTFKGYNNTILLNEARLYQNNNPIMSQNVIMNISLVDFNEIKAITKVIDQEAQLVTTKIYKLKGQSLIKREE